MPAPAPGPGALRFDAVWQNRTVMLLGIVLALSAVDLNRGIVLYQQQKFRSAEREFRRVLASSPANASARLHLAQTLIALNRTPEALAELERALAGRADPDVRFQAGRILRELAEQRFEQLQAVAFGSAAVHELAGGRFERSGDLAEALTHYRAAAIIEPQRPGVHFRIGNVLWRMRNLDEALDELKKELTANPHHALANLRVGEVMAARDESAQAIPYLERSLSAMPSIEGRRELGKAYKKVGRPADARREWEAIAKEQPEDQQIHYLLGNLYRELGADALAKRELDIHRRQLQIRAEQAGKP